MRPGSGPITARFAAYQRGQAAAMSTGAAVGPSRRAAINQSESPARTRTVLRARDGSVRLALRAARGQTGDGNVAALDRALGQTGGGRVAAPDRALGQTGVCAPDRLTGQTGGGRVGAADCATGQTGGGSLAAQDRAGGPGAAATAAGIGASSTPRPADPATNRRNVPGSTMRLAVSHSWPARPGRVATRVASSPITSHAATSQSSVPATCANTASGSVRRSVVVGCSNPWITFIGRGCTSTSTAVSALLRAAVIHRRIVPSFHLFPFACVRLALAVIKTRRTFVDKR
jgi:hypothetical protein